MPVADAHTLSTDMDASLYPALSLIEGSESEPLQAYSGFRVANPNPTPRRSFEIR